MCLEVITDRFILLRETFRILQKIMLAIRTKDNESFSKIYFDRKEGITWYKFISLLMIAAVGMIAAVAATVLLVWWFVAAAAVSFLPILI